MYRLNFKLAEKQRFELWRDSHPLSVFKTDPFSHLGISPSCGKQMVDPEGLEPTTGGL